MHDTSDQTRALEVRQSFEVDTASPNRSRLPAVPVNRFCLGGVALIFCGVVAISLFISSMSKGTPEVTTTTTTTEFGFRCESAYKMTSLQAMPRKGMALDDETFVGCVANATARWPNTNEKVRVMRVFKPCVEKDGNCDKERRLRDWHKLAKFVHANRVSVMMGYEFRKCDDYNLPVSDPMWKYVLELLPILGKEHVFALSVGNELDLKRKDCWNTTFWTTGYMKIIEKCAQDIDKIGFGHVKITAVVTPNVLKGESFKNTDRLHALDFYKQAYARFKERWAWSLNIYSYWGAYGKEDKDCKSWEFRDAGGRGVKETVAIAGIARKAITSVTNNLDDVFWVTETGWGSDDVKGNKMCPSDLGPGTAYSSMTQLRRYYRWFLDWDLSLGDDLVPPDLAFYFTMRDVHGEYFGLIPGCDDPKCKIQGKPAPTKATWYCAIRHSGGNTVIRKTYSLSDAQSVLGVGSELQQQAIIPMTGSEVTVEGVTSLGGDPNTLPKTWIGGSMWWKSSTQLNSMRARCARETPPQGPRISPETVPDMQKTDIGHIVNWAGERTRHAESEFAQYMKDNAIAKRYESPNDWKKSVIYNIQVDRFNNGDPTNDNLNMPEEQRRAMAANQLENVEEWRHGGDFAGITQRLGYMQDMGIDVLWITPVLDHNGGYHGYCTTDPTTTDPSFGSPEEFRTLVTEAHKLGIRVVLDIVVNHMCDVMGGGTTYSPPRKAGDDAIRECAESLDSKYWDGSLATSLKQAKLQFSDKFFPAFRSQNFFNRCGPNTHSQMTGDGATTVFADFNNEMLDFNTRDGGFQEVFTELHKYWVAYADIDGYRLDAAKHVTEDFVSYFSSQMRAYAGTLGKTNFWLIGEVVGPPKRVARSLGSMGHNPQNPDEFDASIGSPAAVTQRLHDIKDVYLANAKFSRPGLNGVYNFYQSGKSKDLLHGREWATSLQHYFKHTNEDMYTVAAQVDNFCNLHTDVCAYGLSQLWTCLEIHDWPRFLQSYPSNIEMSVLGLTWLLTAPGQPVLYYGIEQGFNGDCVEGMPIPKSFEHRKHSFCADVLSHSKYRQDMFKSGPVRLGSAIKKVNDLAGIFAPQSTLSPDWKKDEMLSRDHPIYETVRALAFFRRSCRVLTEGAMDFQHAEDKAGGFFIFTRHADKKKLYDPQVVVLINPQDETINSLPSIELQKNVNPQAGLKYMDVMSKSAEPAGVTRMQDEKVYLDFKVKLEPLRARILVREHGLKTFDDYLKISLCDLLPR